MTAIGNRISLSRDPASGVEAIRARFQGHAYDLHHHDEWLVGYTEHGLQDFQCRGRRRRSTTGTVILIEPEEPHDGEAGGSQGFSYSMLYLPQAWLRDGLAALADGRAVGPPRFARSLVDDAALGRAIMQARMVIDHGEARLVREAALDRVLALLAPHLGARDAAPAGQSDNWAVAARARDHLRDLITEDVGADDLARAAGAANRFQLARAFRARYRTSPHAYLVQARLAAARRLLASGTSPALAAAETGFADQSHLGRWFRRAYGLTPAAYRRTCLAA